MNKRSDLYRRILKGERLDDVLIIDHHGHFGTGLFNRLPLDREVAETVSVMDAIGVDCGVVFYCGADYRRGNQITLESVALAPDRFIPYAYLNTDTPEALLEELERCRQAGMVGLKLHSGWSGGKFADAIWKDVWTCCAQYRWPVIIHGMEPCLARENKQTVFIQAHGIECIFRDEVIQAMRECPNYYWDTSATMTAMGAIERAVALFGADRLVFGGNMPFFDAAQFVVQIKCAMISAADKQKIAFDTLAAKLGMI